MTGAAEPYSRQGVTWPRIGPIFKAALNKERNAVHVQGSLEYGERNLTTGRKKTAQDVSALRACGWSRGHRGLTAPARDVPPLRGCGSRSVQARSRADQIDCWQLVEKKGVEFTASGGPQGRQINCRGRQAPVSNHHAPRGPQGRQKRCAVAISFDTDQALRFNDPTGLPFEPYSQFNSADLEVRSPLDRQVFEQIGGPDDLLKGVAV